MSEERNRRNNSFYLYRYDSHFKNKNDKNKLSKMLQIFGRLIMLNVFKTNKFFMILNINIYVNTQFII